MPRERRHNLTATECVIITTAIIGYYIAIVAMIKKS